MKKFLTFLINRPSTPHSFLVYLLWWFTVTFVMWAGDGCLWTDPPYC